MIQVISIKSVTAEKSKPHGRLIVLTGPSGVGKGTLLRSLLKRHPEIYYSVSATTRSPRPGEVEGQHYYFLSRSKFEQSVAQGEFLEWAEFAGNYYGTLREPVKDRVNSGQNVVLEIELEGARQVRASYPDAFSIFILPPSLDELEKRIRRRGQDSQDAITRRLHLAEKEIQAASEFDLQIVNEDFETALQSMEAVLFP
ncbi:MAG: guanylate kinase [Mastigocoleus sp.]